MVGIFAGLKWHLVTSRLRATHGAKRAWMILGFVLALAFIGLITIGLIALRARPDIALTVTITFFTVQLVGWLVAPMVAFGVDETVDPARFALLPIRPQTLQRGLLIASLVGYLPAANMIVLLGASVAIGVPWSVFPIAVVCALVQLITCVVLSRAASTSMAGLMSSRRGRDLGMAVGFGVVVLYMLFSATVNGGNGAGVASGSTSVASVLAWFPPGALASLPSLVASGQWGRAALAAVVALAALALAWWWWSGALQRSLTTVPSTTAGSSPAGRGREGHAVAIGVSGTARVVAGRDRLLIWRDPMRRMPWLMIAFLTVIWPFLVIQGKGAVFGVAFGALLVGAQAGNQYGVEGSGLWLHLQTISDRIRARGEVLGHAVAALVPGMIIVLVALAIQAVWRNDYDKVPAALGVSLGALLGAIATACYLSAALPYAMPQSRKSLFASSIPGQKGRTAGASLGLLGGGLVVALPAGIAAALSLTVDPVWGWVALVIGPAVGMLALWWAARLTADRYLERAPEILAIVSAGDRG